MHGRLTGKRRPVTGRAHRDRPGPQGGHRVQRAPGPHVPPTPPLAGVPGPASLYMGPSSSSMAGYRYYPSPYPPLSHTHPSTPPHRPPTVRRTGWSTTRFEVTVGEPRGMRTHTLFRVLAVFSTDQEYGVLQEIMTETGIQGPVSNEACGRSILRSI